MSDNSSFNNHSSPRTYVPSTLVCYLTSPGFFIYTLFYVNCNLILLPVCVYILHLSFQQWRRRRSASSASHSDCFTFHLVTIELFGVFAHMVFFCGLCKDDANILLAGYCLWSLSWYGQVYFNILTCVERYLAVVHPVTYLSLRRERGTRIRNAAICCVWLLCIAGVSVVPEEVASLTLDLIIVVFSMPIVTFCSLSVLCALINPRPGDQGGDKARVDQSKQRAFYTIMAILGVLLMRFIWCLIWVSFTVSMTPNDCLITVVGVWFNFGSSLVLPLLFLHRKGALPRCNNNAKQG